MKINMKNLGPVVTKVALGIVAGIGAYTVARAGLGVAAALAARRAAAREDAEEAARDADTTAEAARHEAAEDAKAIGDA